MAKQNRHTINCDSCRGLTMALLHCHTQLTTTQTLTSGSRGSSIKSSLRSSSDWNKKKYLLHVLKTIQHVQCPFKYSIWDKELYTSIWLTNDWNYTPTFTHELYSRCTGATDTHVRPDIVGQPPQLLQLLLHQRVVVYVDALTQQLEVHSVYRGVRRSRENSYNSFY